MSIPCFLRTGIGPLCSGPMRGGARLRVWLPLWIAGGVLCEAGSSVRAQPNEGRGIGEGELVQRKAQRKAPGQRERVPEAEAPLMPLRGVAKEPVTGVAGKPVLGVGEEPVGGINTSAVRSARLLPYGDDSEGRKDSGAGVGE